MWGFLKNILNFKKGIFTDNAENLYIHVNFWKNPPKWSKPLLRQALTHPSFEKGEDYERMEFLGDSVWGLIVASYLFEHYPELDEGSLTLLKAYFTNNTFISKLSKKIGLGRLLRVGKSYRFPVSESTLADIFESFVAYLYLTYGFEATKKWGYKVMHHIVPGPEGIEKILFSFDPKGRLQAILSKEGLFPEYDVVKEGKMFRATVYVDKKPIAQGRGYSIRDAEKDAANRALMVLIGNEKTER